jgi:hypothetical protein
MAWHVEIPKGVCHDILFTQAGQAAIHSSGRNVHVVNQDAGGTVDFPDAMQPASEAW